MSKKFITIKCPKCNYEYLPEDIYTNMLGKPSNEIRDKDGRILYFDGESLDLDEEYICDRCGCTFKVSMKPTFETKIYTEHDFSEDYSVPLYSEDRISLDEPEEVQKLWEEDDNIKRE